MKKIDQKKVQEQGLKITTTMNTEHWINTRKRIIIFKKIYNLFNVNDIESKNVKKISFGHICYQKLHLNNKNMPKYYLFTPLITSKRRVIYYFTYQFKKKKYITRLDYQIYLFNLGIFVCAFANFRISLFQMGLYLSLCDLGNNNIARVLLILGHNRTSFVKKIICRATLICSATEIKIDRQKDRQIDRKID